MNKYIIVFAFLAIGAVAANEEPESQAALVPTDDEEVAELRDSMLMFKDFCIESRDYVVGDLKNSDSTSAAVFNSFYSGAGEGGAKASKVQKKPAGRLTPQTMDPDSPITEGEQIDKLITEGQKQMAQDKMQPASLFASVKGSLSAAAGSVGQAISKRLEAVYAKANPTVFFNSLKSICGDVKGYNEHITAEFEKVSAEFGDAVHGIQYKDLDCVTTKRISQINEICELVETRQFNPMKWVFPYMG